MANTALIIEAPESETIVKELRTEFDRTALRGVPAHITILHPFMPVSALTSSVLDTLRGITEDTAAFSYRLEDVGRFDTALWLRPEPEIPFIELTKKITKVFPQYLPYEGKHSTIQPHLTIAQFAENEKSNPQWSLIGENTSERLPVECSAFFLSIYACDVSGYWTKYIALPFTKSE